MRQEIMNEWLLLHQKLEESEPDDASLFYGKAGLLYYLHHYDRVIGKNTHVKKIRRFSEELVAAVFSHCTSYTNISLSTGITGPCSILHLLAEKKMIAQLPATAEKTDEYLFSRCMQEYDPGIFNYSTGIAGVISYFCKREKLPAMQKYLAVLVEKLASTSYPANYPETEVNFTLWQGLCGRISLLLRLQPLFPGNGDIHFTIRHYLHLLYANMLHIDAALHRHSFFPVSAEQQTGLVTAPNNLFWESGDLPAALIFYRAYKTYGDAEYKKLADLVASYSLTRKETSQTGLHHSGFCGGSSGTAMMFLLLGNESGQNAYHGGYKYWMQKSCDYFRQTAGYEQSITAPLFAHGLAWLGYLYNLEPDWVDLLIP
jgi:hypothetical protein